MRRRAGLAIALALALCVDRALAQNPAAAAPQGAGADSSRAVPAPPLGALADSLTARVARLRVARARLAPDDRQVLDEFVAAAREMADAGDLEGAALVIEDARQLVSKKAR